MPLINIKVYDKYHEKLFKVTKEIGHALPMYTFYKRGEEYGIFEKQFDLVKDRFSMDTNEGMLELTEYVGMWGRNFKVTLNGRVIGAVMDNLKFNIQNIIFDNSVIIVYESEYLPLLTVMVVMVAREIARDENN